MARETISFIPRKNERTTINKGVLVTGVGRLKQHYREQKCVYNSAELRRTKTIIADVLFVVSHGRLCLFRADRAPH